MRCLLSLLLPPLLLLLLCIKYDRKWQQKETEIKWATTTESHRKRQIENDVTKFLSIIARHTEFDMFKEKLAVVFQIA